MARCIPDPISGLPWRPYKSHDEIDLECELALRAFLALPLVAGTPVPVSTDLLTTLIEVDAERLDLFADLPPAVEGCTDITAQGQPWVRINHRLSTDPQCAHRLRHTLAHEWYHVRFHAPLYQAQFAERRSLVLASGLPEEHALPPTRQARQGRVDWREWQAAYGAGALLMPRSAVVRLPFCNDERYGRPPYAAGTAQATAVAQLVATVCKVSLASARIRLEQLGMVVAPGAGDARLRVAAHTRPLRPHLPRADAPEDEGSFWPECCRGGGLDRRDGLLLRGRWRP